MWVGLTQSVEGLDRAKPDPLNKRILQQTNLGVGWNIDSFWVSQFLTINFSLPTYIHVHIYTHLHIDMYIYMSYWFHVTFTTFLLCVLGNPCGHDLRLSLI